MLVAERIGRPIEGLRTITRVSAVLALAAALTGCLSDKANWIPPESSKKARVERVAYRHTVNFADTGARLSLEERERLNSFLDRIGIGYGDDVSIGARGQKDGARGTAVADRRIATILSLVQSRQVRPTILTAALEDKAWDGSVRVVVGRYIVFPPHCPDWTKASDGDWTNRTYSQWGCSTAVNFSLMLADPGDLVRARTLSPGDGEHDAKAIKKYRGSK